MTSSPGLNFLIAKYLRTLPNPNLANEFVQTLEINELLPSARNWNGVERQISFTELEQQYAHVPDDHLSRLLENLMSYVEQGIGKRFGSLSTFLLQLDPTCFLQNKRKTASSNERYNMFRTAYHQCKYSSGSKTKNLHLILREREYFGRTLSVKQLPPSDLYRRMNLRLKVSAHKASVYCITFDRTGNYALSGADDFLLKMWHVNTGRLLASFRGHSKEICDIDINFENTLVASASLDKKVRVWNLKTTKMECVLHGHQSGVHSTKFSPFCKTDDRWLASVGSDGSICFWKYRVGTTNFELRPIKFVEKSRAGAQMLCLSFSPGGYFLAAGSSDSVIRVYSFHTYTPLKICELDRHTSVVETICYSHLSNSFVSGGRDGTARIWRFEQQTWRAIVLNYDHDNGKNNEVSSSSMTNQKVIPVTIVAWSCTDRHVATAYENGLIKVWEPNQGSFVNELKKHERTVFVLEAHPTNERLLCSAGHDGFLVIWDIIDGRIIKHFLNDQYIDIPNSIPFSEAKWSPHSDIICTTDLCGQVCFFGLGTHSNYNKTQTEQFFHNDLRPVIRDSNDYVLDEQQQLPPHLLPPPFLIDDHGQAYPSAIQRFVPGRENYSDNDNTATVINHEYLDDLIIAEPATTPAMTSVHMTRKFEIVDISSFRLNVEKKQTFIYHRNLIPSLGERELELSERIRDTRYDEERSIYEREYLKKANYNDSGEFSPVKKRTTRNLVKMRQEELLKRVPRNVEVAINRLTTRALYDSDKEDKTDLSDDQYSPNPDGPVGESEMSGESGDSVSTDEELVVTSHRISGIVTRTGQQRRIQRHRNLPPDEDDEDDDENQIRQVQEAKTQHRRRNKLKRLKKRREQVKTKKEEFENKDEFELHYSSAFQPPEWLTRTSAGQCSPYIPQIGDIVIYFQQGHQLYINEVKDKKMYEIDEKTLPWIKCDSLDPVECATVVGVSISFSDKQPPRVINVRLQILNPDTLEPTPRRISVKFHDVDGIADFLILKQHYDQALQRQWNTDDRFRCFIDDTWWPGTVIKREPFDQRHEQSPFQCFVIRWENGESEERLSPWDMFPCEESFEELDDSTPMKINGYEPTNDEWPAHGVLFERERLLKGLDDLMKMDVAEQFRAPVQLAWYPVVIAYPIDLGTIRERIANGFYRRSNALKWDVKKMEENAKNFNERGSQIIEQVKIITKVLLKFIDDDECEDINLIYQRSLYAEQVSLPLSSSMCDDWLDDCQTILNDILSQPGADLLRYPIDENEYPDYERIVKNPICFDDVQNKLSQYPAGYRHSREFIADCHLIFQNALTYADPEMINVVRQLGPWFDQRVAIFDRRQRRSHLQHQSDVSTRQRDLNNSSADENNGPTTMDAPTTSTSRQNRRGQFSPTTAATTDRRHSHFNRPSTLVNNESAGLNDANSNDEQDDDDDDESMSTKSGQPFCLTSFISTSNNNDPNVGPSSSQRQTRQVASNNETNGNFQRRTRHHRQNNLLDVPSSSNSFDQNRGTHLTTSSFVSRNQSESEDERFISNNRRNRTSSNHRPNYKIDSDDHDDENDEQISRTNRITESVDQTESRNEREKSKTEDEDYEPTVSNSDEEDEEGQESNSAQTIDQDDSDSDFEIQQSREQTRRSTSNVNRVRKLRSTTNRPSPPLNNQSVKRKRSNARSRFSSNSDSSLSSSQISTNNKRSRLRRRPANNKKSTFDEDFSDDEDENRRQPRTTQATRVSKRGRVLKQRLLSD